MGGNKDQNKPNQNASLSWGPSSIGKFFTTTPDWSLTLQQQKFLLLVGNNKHQGDVCTLDAIQITPGSFWTTVVFPIGKRDTVTLDGIPNDTAKAMRNSVLRVIRTIKDRQRKDALIKELPLLMKPVLEWSSKTIAACKVQLKVKGWLTHDFKIMVNQSKPHELEVIIDEPDIRNYLKAQPDNIKNAIKFWEQSFDEYADSQNEAHLINEIEVQQEFFDRVEKSPLTKEQIKAVVCFDNRVLLVASAGSGKTSTMVAKAGYALKKGYFSADRMLLLAFNNDAATELRDRIKARLEPLGLPADQIISKTFHAFGLDVIGQATGKRPSLAAWVESGRDIDTLLEIVDNLKDQNILFRTQWDMFRIVIGQDLPAFGKEAESPDSWNKVSKSEGFWTLNNDVVKSRGELLIANWLFYNGVNYQYEEPYKIDTADESHRQYRPDFYFPDVDVYLEHWALDQHGRPPEEFKGYQESMDWKKEVHAKNGTKLLETTTAGLWSGKAFTYLADELTKLGVVLDPNPDRVAPGRKPIENPRLARTFRTFLTHTKSNRLTLETLKERVNEGVAGQFKYRHAMFLSLFESMWNAWEEKLKEDKCIDFEDMLNLACDSIEQGKWSSPFNLVMVDEFQDVSHARARLLAGLINKSGKCLFAVGDDWQSINRFAGADIGVMTHFEERFGSAQILKLETTFRCPQSLCDISSKFVQKNPSQITKKVHSSKDNIAEPVRILRVVQEEKIRLAISKRIEEIASTLTSEQKITIYILGRYNHEKQCMPIKPVDSRISTKFVTVHSSKGREADHVIIPRLTSETLGFPSRVEDDPVLQLAMPLGDSYSYAEERRLFYVGLTRSRGTVTLITLAHKESPFIFELLKDYGIKLHTIDGDEDLSELCPVCKEGFLVQRNGQYGPFLSCSRYPRCDHTRKQNKSTTKPPPVDRRQKNISEGKPPKSHFPWSDEERQSLVETFRINPNLDQLAHRFERSVLAVAAQLLKLNIITEEEFDSIRLLQTSE